MSFTNQVNITVTNTEIVLGRGDRVTINVENRTQTNDSVINATSELELVDTLMLFFLFKTSGYSGMDYIVWRSLYLPHGRIDNVDYVVTTMMMILMTS